MFVRIKKNTGTNRRTVLICHNIRFQKKVKQLTVKCIGHSSNAAEIQAYLEEGRAWILNHGKAWLNQLKTTQNRKRMRNKIHLENLREESRINVGIEDIFGKLYREIGFHELLSKSHQNTLRQLVFSRLLEPASKRRLSLISETYFSQELPLDRIYRMMDKLITSSATVEQKIFSATQAVLNGKVSLVLFDVTTLSFETISEDELRAFGFSKDFKFNTTQVVLALATTPEGLPVGYRLFPGNTAESKTLIEAIGAWREQIPIDDVTIVGDRAMMSEDNLLALEAAGFYYVVAFPLRKLPKKEQSLVLDKNRYVSMDIDNEINSYQILNKNSRRLVVTYSKKRAEKDRKDRERFIKKLEKKLQGCKDVKRLVNNKGYLKYTEISGTAKAYVNEANVACDAQWDGLHGVITNKPVKGCEIYQEYRRLWVIEESFRINKHNLKMRPIYHFTPNRIQAHILICYMVFTLIRHLQFKLSRSGESMSVNRIVDALRNVQASILHDTVYGNKYKMLSALSEDAEIIYKVYNIKQQSSITQLEYS